MSEAPTAGGEGEFLVLVEFCDETRTWLCVAPTGFGEWGICGTDHLLSEYPEGWVLVGAEVPQDVVTVLGWIPAPTHAVTTERQNDESVFRSHWPAGLKQDEVYELPCDDKGRAGGVWLRVFVAADGDVHLVMQDWEDMPQGEPNPIPSLRVRTLLGGGRNTRTHQALLWLAQAIRLDAAERRRFRRAP